MEKKKGNRTNHPNKKYVFWNDWQSWYLKEWLPFLINDFAHLKNDMRWVKVLLTIVLGAIITAAIALLSKG